MKLDNNAVRRMYDRFSSIPLMWEVNTWLQGMTERAPTRVRAIELLQLRPGSSVLDVACGTGLNFPELQRHLQGHGRLVGVDLSPKTLEIAQRTVAKAGWTNVELFAADSAEYEPTQQFDACLCTFALEIIPQYVETLDKMTRALRPGGRLAIVGFQRSRHPIAAHFNPVFEAMGGLFGGELGRDIPGNARLRGREVCFESYFGGFYCAQATERVYPPLLATSDRIVALQDVDSGET